MVSIDALASEIAASVREYTDEIVEAIPAVLDEVARETLADVKAASPKDRGAYARSWAVKKVRLGNGRESRLIHNRDHYQITHLLEFGHANHSGGRTKALPHIGAVADEHAADLERRIASIVGRK